MDQEKELPNSSKELRLMYRVKSRTTWWNWLEPLRSRGKIRLHAKLYQAHELNAIVALLGYP